MPFGILLALSVILFALVVRLAKDSINNGKKVKQYYVNEHGKLEGKW